MIDFFEFLLSLLSQFVVKNPIQNVEDEFVCGIEVELSKLIFLNVLVESI
jgi:hypothetical protein